MVSVGLLGKFTYKILDANCIHKNIKTSLLLTPIYMELFSYRLGFERDGNQEKPRRVAIKSMDKKKLPLNKGAASDVMNEVKILSKLCAILFIRDLF